MSNLTIRPLCSGYIPTKPLEYWYHFSCSKFIEKYGLTNELDQLPDFTFLIEGGEQLILVDTGMSWDEHADKYHHGPSTQRPGIDDIESRLAQCGYKPEDVDIVLFTHLHWDHVFYIEKFVNARFIVNEVEWNYAHNPVSLHFKSYCRPIICKDGDVTYKDQFVAPYDIVDEEAGLNIPARFETVKGEVEIAPGVIVFETFGHSPGSMSVMVETEEGPYFCVGDAVFVMGNIDAPQDLVDKLHYDICPPGRYVDMVAAWETIREFLRRCHHANVDPYKHLLLAHDVMLSAACEAYEADHDNKLPVIGRKDSDFVFEKYSKAIIAKEAAAKGADPAAVERKYFGAKADSKPWAERAAEIGGIKV